MFKIGDCVKLKTGGPEMVIVDESRNLKHWFCKWWDTDGDCYHQESFPKEALCPGGTTED